MTRPHRILIVKLSAIGDVVHTLPFLEVLRGNFPTTPIDWVVEEEASSIIRGHRDLSRIIVSRRKSWQRNLAKGKDIRSTMKEVSSFLRELRTYEYDWVIDLQGLLKSGILTGLSRGRRKIGMQGARESGGFSWNEPPVPVDYSQHAIDRYLQVADYLHCRRLAWEGRIPFSEADSAVVDSLLAKRKKERQPLVAVNPMARWKTKLWEPTRFAALAQRIGNELGGCIVFTGGPGDREIIEKIAGEMKNRPLNLAGRTSLKELACLYSRCNVLVTTDTGPMHIAAAVGCSVVALFGPTAPLRTGPYGEGHRLVRAEMDCSPCFRKTCDHMSCMGEITVKKVFEAVKEVLEERN